MCFYPRANIHEVGRGFFTGINNGIAVQKRLPRDNRVTLLMQRNVERGTFPQLSSLLSGVITFTRTNYKQGFAIYRLHFSSLCRLRHSSNEQEYDNNRVVSNK